MKAVHGSTDHFLSVGPLDIDAAYCKTRHGGEHLFRQEGCGSWTARAIYDELHHNAHPEHSETADSRTEE